MISYCPRGLRLDVYSICISLSSTFIQFLISVTCSLNSSFHTQSDYSYYLLWQWYFETCVYRDQKNIQNQSKYKQSKTGKLGLPFQTKLKAKAKLMSSCTRMLLFRFFSYLISFILFQICRARIGFYAPSTYLYRYTVCK